MDWVKIKVQHVLSTGLSAEQIGRLVQYQALIALKERAPKDWEIAGTMRVKSLENLRRTLLERGENLDSIADKVLFDVDEFLDERRFQRDKKRIQRVKSRLKYQNVPGDVPDEELGMSWVDKTRLDKTRLDKTTNQTNKGGLVSDCLVGENPDLKMGLELPVDWADTVHRYCVLEGRRRAAIPPEKRVGKKDQPIVSIEKFFKGTKARCLDDREAFFQIKAELEELEAKAKAQEVAERNNAILQQYRNMEDPTPVRKRVAEKLGCEEIDVVPGYHDNYIIQVMIEIAEESRRGGKSGPTHDDFLEIARRVIWVRNQTGEGVPTPDAELLARAYSMSPDEFGDAMLEITEFEVNQIELEGRI